MIPTAISANRTIRRKVKNCRKTFRNSRSRYSATYGAQHPRRFLPSPAAPEEAHDGDDGPDAEEDVRAQVVVSLLVRGRLEVEITEQHSSPGLSDKKP